MSSEKPDISVLIPAYNVEDWVASSLDSLLKQSFRNFEILIADDGSTDSTPQICDDYQVKHEQIRVFHIENSGAASARNYLIDRARGKYFYFMDADDWAEENMLEEMFEFAESNSLELVICGYFIDTYYAEDKYYRELRTAPDTVFKTQQDFRNYAYKFFDAQLLYAPWNKLYLASYIKENKIYYPKTFWDDLPFNLEVVRDIKRVGCFSSRYYHFLRARGEAENAKYRPNMYEKREEENELMHELFAYWNLDTPEIREYLGRRHAERLIGCLENITNSACKLSYKEKKAEIKKILDSASAKQALQYAKSTSIMIAAIYFPMRRKFVSIVFLENKFISFVKTRSTNIFARLKANR
ncbi:MAG: glycosyltransferase family 2 protein [Eggerthellaceae bacterium]|nr:glycosyltransferase family 2 protein [Eggerthellaceae bacterium]